MQNFISDLFEKAKTKDEFYFVCTLINYKGMGSKYFTSNLFEWFNAVDYYESIYTKEKNLHKKVRIGLLLYSTFFESTDLYNILGNLSRNVLGYQGSPYLYWKHKNADRWLGTSEKISLVTGVLSDAKSQEISTFLLSNHIKQLRNSFFHSSYSIEGDSYYLKDSEPIDINGVLKSELSITKFILPKIDDIIDFFKNFKNTYLSQCLSYNTNKQIMGCFPKKTDILILGSAEGLKGFVSGGSYVKLDNDFWTAMNIRFEKLSEEKRFIIDEIKRFIEKVIIKTNDGSLQYLYEVVNERKFKDEMLALSVVYRRFGDMKSYEANKEKNEYKQIDLEKRALSFYQKMLNLNNETVTNDIAILKFSVAISDENIELIKEAFEDFFNCISIDRKENPIKNALIVITYLKDIGVDISVFKQRFIQLLKKNDDNNLEELVKEVIESLDKL